MTQPTDTKGTLKEVMFGGVEPVLEWEYVQHNYLFVFYKPHEKTTNNEWHGFNFVSLEIIGYHSDELLLFPENYVEILYWGSAYFDGVRHLYFGDKETENYGYTYYPSLKDHIKILKIIHELEATYCSGTDEYTNRH